MNIKKYLNIRVKLNLFFKIFQRAQVMPSLRHKNILKINIFLMLLPDDLIIKNNCSKEMIRLYKKTKGSIIATKKSREKNSIKMGNFINPK